MKARTVWKGIQFGAIGVTTAVLNAVDQGLGRRYLIRELSRLPALGHKMGQLLTMRFGSEEGQAFTPKAAPLSWVKARIEAEAPLLAFEVLEIDPNPALASLGQVHRARLASSEDVAIKMRYPEVDQQLEEQLELVLLAFRNIPKYVSQTLDVDSYKEFFRSFFKEELDYRHEAGVQKNFREAWKDVPEIVVPEVFESFSSGSILVQRFEPSIELTEICQLSLDKRLRCATLLSRFFLESLFRTGLVHTDLHPKNWGFRPDSGELVIYDFGATLRLNPSIIATLGALAHGVIPTLEGYVEAYASLGFESLALGQVKEVLPELTGLFFAPFRSQVPFDFQTWNVQEKAEELLGDHKWVFRSAGPPWFLMVIRGFNGWLHAVKELRASVDLTALMSRANMPTPLQAAAHQAFESAAAQSGTKIRLRVQIRDAGAEVVFLEFPATTVECLEDLMPDAVLEDLTREGIDLAKIKAEALSTGLKAQQLFEKSKGTRVYRVWLE